jgi:hypothetical protein
MKGGHLLEMGLARMLASAGWALWRGWEMDRTMGVGVNMVRGTGSAGLLVVDYGVIRVPTEWDSLMVAL